MTDHASNAAPPAPSAQIIQLGQRDYAEVFAEMRAFTDARTRDTPDQFWIVEHPPVYTLGLGADPAHILQAHNIPIIQTDRGGEVTYHGPGQVVIYLLMDLRRQKPGGKLYAKEFVNRIEQAVLNTLTKYNLAGERKAGAPGIYLTSDAHTAPRWHGAKIAALGLKVRGNGCTYHGVSLNVAMDLQAFSWINPCGYANLVTVDMQSAGAQVNPASLGEVQLALAQELQALL